MQIVGLQNLWHRFIPLSMLPLFNEDILIARKVCKRLINLLVRQLHHLWIQWCLIIYAKASNKVIIEELIELKEEIQEIQILEAYVQLLSDKWISLIRDLVNA